MSLAVGTDVQAPRKVGVNWAQLVIVLMLCLSSGLIGLTLPYAKNASKSGDALVNLGEIQGCRSTAGAAITEARNAKDQRDTDLAIANSRFEVALLNGDSAAAAQLRIDIPAAQAMLITATQHLDAVNQTYQREILLSNSDPAGFVKACRDGRLAPPPTTTPTFAPLTTTTTTVPTTKAPTHKKRRTVPSSSTTTTGSTSTTTTFHSSPRPTSPPTTCVTLPLVTVPGDSCL